MIDLIQQGLARIESEQQVKILYACESGSRAWGFASQDSDYDVRFIYCHPRSWYLSIFEQRDVIECPIVGDLDINGWDLRKALQLASKSNPALLEWMRSPIVYRQDAEFVDRFRPLMDECYSAAAMFHHYLHMAQRNFKEHLRGDTVRAKKYFYVLRPILACRWIIADYGVPPMEFAKLVDRLIPKSGMRDEIESLLQQKIAGEESDMHPRIPAISDYLERSFAELQDVAQSIVRTSPKVEKIEAFFRSWMDV